MMYRHKKQISIMNDERLTLLFKDLETNHRSGEFNCSDPHITKEQLEGIKKTWSPELLAILKTQVMELSAKNKDKPLPVNTYNGILPILLNEVAKNRAKLKNREVNEPDIKRITADFSLSMIFNVAPFVDFEKEIRDINGSKFFICSMSRFKQFVITCKESDYSDYFVAAFFNSQLKRAWLAGWIDQKNLRLAKRGNRITDPENCRWTDMSYYVPTQELKPMSELLRIKGIKNIPYGHVFELMPNQDELPDPQESFAFLEPGAEDASSDFYSILGIDAPTRRKEVDEPKTIPIASNNDFEF